MMTTGEKIKMLRKELGLTQDDLAIYAHTKKQTIHKYEVGIIQNIPASKIKLLAERLNTTPAFLMGWDDTPQENDKNIKLVKSNKMEKTVPIPIVGEVAAGSGSYADINNSIIDYFDIPESWVKGDEDYVLLKVSGDSMLPEFMEDDLVLIRCQTSVDSGDFAVAIIDDENGVIKRVRYGKDWIELQSLNPIYAPRYFEDKEVLRVRIFGLVRKIIRDYK